MPKANAKTQRTTWESGAEVFGFRADGTDVNFTADALIEAVGGPTVVNVSSFDVVGGSDTSTELATAVASLSADDVLYFPPTASPYQFSQRFDIPDDVTVHFGGHVQVTFSGDTGFLRLGNRSTVEGRVTITGTGQSADSKCIDLQTSKSDQRVEGVTFTAWIGYGVYGVASTRPHIIGVRGTVTGTAGHLIRLTTGSTSGWNGTGDVVEAFVFDCHADTTNGGIQLDGDWNDEDWKTTGFKVSKAKVIGCSGHDGNNAGIFINSGFECTVSACEAYDNGDYGIGFEYCVGSVISGCTARGNTTHGLTLQSNNYACAIIGGAGISNTLQGADCAFTDRLTGTDTPGEGNIISGVTVRGNGNYGIAVSGAMVDTVIGPVTYADNTTGKMFDGGSGTVVLGDPLDTLAAGSIAWGGVPGVDFVGSAATNAIAADFLYCEPFEVLDPRGITVTSMRMEVTTAGTASARARLGIVAADSDWQPTGDVLLAGSEIDCSTTGAKSNTGLSTHLPRGRYLKLFTSNEGITVRYLLGSSRMFGGLNVTLGSNPFITRLIVARTYAALSGTMPDWDTVTGQNAAAGLRHFSVLTWTDG